MRTPKPSKAVADCTNLPCSRPTRASYHCASKEAGEHWPFDTESSLQLLPIILITSTAILLCNATRSWQMRVLQIPVMSPKTPRVRVSTGYAFADPAMPIGWADFAAAVSLADTVTG